MEFETTFIATELGVVAYDDAEGVRWPVKENIVYQPPEPLGANKAIWHEPPRANKGMPPLW